MVSRKTISAITVFGAALLGGMTSSVAGPLQTEVRLGLIAQCEKDKDGDLRTGQIRAYCMKMIPEKMETYIADADTQYQQCIDNNNLPSDCDESLENFWQQRIRPH